MLNLSDEEWFQVFNGDKHILNGKVVDKNELAKYINSMSNAMFVVLRMYKVPDIVIEGITQGNQRLVTDYLYTVQSNSDLTGEEKAIRANIILWAANTINISSACGMVFINDVVSTGKLPATGREIPKDLN